jgi:hypothetical protein
MKKFYVLGIALGLTFFVSCGKQETEAEKKAEIEREVQQRLAAERQADEQQKLVQRAADLAARESALAEKEKERVATPSATPEMRATQVQQRDASEADRGMVRRGEDEGESYNTFYTKLEPYGAWRETSDYGYVWQPAAAERSRNWRPYTNGRWIYTDSGWTWYSEEPFGWATYHYGRWTRLRNIGWVWVPGDEWAPAWVSWRKSNDYVGWAPLPPEARFDRRTGIQNWADNYYDIGPERYAFVPTNDFGEQQIERTVVPVERNVTIVEQTTNVTNITYNNTTIINQGPNYDELRQRTRQPIQRLRLERRQRFENDNPQTVVRGEVIEMSAPTIAPVRPADRPRAVKEKIAQTIVDRSSAEIHDQKAAEKARAKMKAEATPPTAAPPLRKTNQRPDQQTAVATESATPAQNLPQPGKIPHPKTPPAPTIAATPGVSAAPSQQPLSAHQEKIKAARQMKEAQKEKMRAQEKTAQEQRVKERQAIQQQKAEELRKMKEAKKQPASPSPAVSSAPHSTPAVKPTATPPVAKVPPIVEKKPTPLPAIAPSAKPSPVTSVSPNEKKNGKAKKKDRNGRGDVSPSPSVSRE